MQERLTKPRSTQRQLPPQRRKPSLTRAGLLALSSSALVIAALLVWKSRDMKLTESRGELAALQSQYAGLAEQVNEADMEDRQRGYDKSRRKLTGKELPPDEGELANSAALLEISRLVPERAVVRSLFTFQRKNQWIVVLAGDGGDIDPTTAQGIFTEFYQKSLKSPLFTAVEFDPLRLEPKNWWSYFYAKYGYAPDSLKSGYGLPAMTVGVPRTYRGPAIGYNSGLYGGSGLPDWSAGSSAGLTWKKDWTGQTKWGGRGGQTGWTGGTGPQARVYAPTLAKIDKVTYVLTFYLRDTNYLAPPQPAPTPTAIFTQPAPAAATPAK